jgi:UDP-2,3-diacylglucosamine pyrophosphatase LpxH
VFLAALRDRHKEGDQLRSDLGRLVAATEAKLLRVSVSSPTYAANQQESSDQLGQKLISWLHISDVHFRTSETYNANIVAKALLLDIKERIAEDGLRPDFIAFTGDTAFSGRSTEYELAKQFFFDLLTATDVSAERLFLVPGNHDVDRSLISKGAQAIGDSLADRDTANSILATPADLQFMTSRFQGYRTFVNSCFRESSSCSDDQLFYVRKLAISGRKVMVAGFNSAWLCASDEDKQRGLVLGERQVRMALDECVGADLTIALLHHPLDWLREFDQNDSGALLVDNCDFVLHGHLHQSSLTGLSTPDGDAMVIACGACYVSRQFPNSYNYVQLNVMDNTCKVHLRRYTDARGGFWARDTLTYRNVPDGIYNFVWKTV